MDLKTVDSVEAFDSEGSRALRNGSQKNKIKYCKKPRHAAEQYFSYTREDGGMVDSQQEFVIKGHPSVRVWWPNLKLLEGNYREVAMVLRRVEGMELTELQDLFHVVDEWLQVCLKTSGSVTSRVISHIEFEWHMDPVFILSFQFSSFLLFDHILKHTRKHVFSLL